MVGARADVDARNNDGATALMLATYARKEPVVRALLSSGARYGLSSALAFAEQSESPSLATTLREAMPPQGATTWLGSLAWTGLVSADSSSDVAASASSGFGVLEMSPNSIVSSWSQHAFTSLPSPSCVGLLPVFTSRLHFSPLTPTATPHLV